MAARQDRALLALLLTPACGRPRNTQRAARNKTTHIRDFEAKHQDKMGKSRGKGGWGGVD